ncbi:hypothetical protein QQS21_006408 [Conoideocrella luteorostrata]|uniref:Transferase family protein n=1 Tax=Conoideocrella luteorostrata TaxID=1105319 RepID=A0AAJ0CPZ4_9HYPO|nr:hypothetical protein QQS21_006408 [Conoideocrella luteorostrata]
MASPGIFIEDSTRVYPRSRTRSLGVVPLSLLDATTANFALSNAIWLFDRSQSRDLRNLDLAGHFRQTLSATLDAYPHFAGQVKAIRTADGGVSDELAHLPAHARRFGRVYARFGTDEDPGVAYITATSSYTLDELHPLSRTENTPLWDQGKGTVAKLAPPEAVAKAFDPDEKPLQDTFLPVVAVQVTKLACGCFALAVKATHPLVDITGLRTFVKDWASISRAVLSGDDEPVPRPIFDPSKLDYLAAGDINAPVSDPGLVERAENLPLHRYDWWASAATCPWPMEIPDPFQHEALGPSGKIMPWSEWDVTAPVSHYVIHLTKEQVEYLYATARRESRQKISRHDAILAHIWSCVVRSRNLADGLVHCDLVYGVRPHLHAGMDFIGSPMLIMDVEMSVLDITKAGGVRSSCSTSTLGRTASRVRETITAVAQPESISAHLHSVAYEKSPQRIWQAFMGQRHVLVTSWARAGVYDVDFGLGPVRYVDSVMPNMDGIVVIKEAPPHDHANSREKSQSWTDEGVDVSVHIEEEAMKRLLEDSLLLPRAPKS